MWSWIYNKNDLDQYPERERERETEREREREKERERERETVINTSSYPEKKEIGLVCMRARASFVKLKIPHLRTTLQPLKPSALYCWILEILYCAPKGRRALLRIPSTEGRSVCLCWAKSKPKGPKGNLISTQRKTDRHYCTLNLES